ncbi:hypothetical protein C8P68_106230 [Mucilaginibacter yixingensis]|uniref:Uncharacterized protein n=1 Tax=Mucilaginibacter yixingensis TaxID=1295612 RepID=A0A2T5J794_9SPHI|nr:hypothetical protein [Mucilaginibacter yixingensis]PTQ95015.1 hypothetical protein C8P68_106230 [Mucilaginibacter yixingensis]
MRKTSVSVILLLIWIIISQSVKAQVKDTIYVYKYGDLLFSSMQKLKLGFISKNEAPSKWSKEKITYRTDGYQVYVTITGKPSGGKIGDDTIYADNQRIFTDGDRDAAIAVYKRYKSLFVFDAFKAKIYRGKLAAPDFGTDLAAKNYITRIRYTCKHTGVNFAGHYTIVEWGCGTECENIAIVNRINGKIFFSEINYGADEGFFGVSYKPDSRMLIGNSANLEDYKGYTLCRQYNRLKILEWTGKEFKIRYFDK